MKIIRYFFVGGAAAVVDICLYTIFAVYLEYNYFVVASGSFVIALLVNYFLSIKYIFKSGVRFSSKHEILVVFIASGIGLLMTLIMLYFMIEVVGLDKFISKVVSTGLVFGWNYSIRNYYIFCSKL
jgi:putative flippase GtrA